MIAGNGTTKISDLEKKSTITPTSFVRVIPLSKEVKMKIINYSYKLEMNNWTKNNNGNEKSCKW